MIAGTPTIFINGRVFDGHQDMNDWIVQELANIKEGGGSPPASGSASTPASSASPSGSSSGRADAGKPAPAAVPKK